MTLYAFGLRFEAPDALLGRLTVLEDDVRDLRHRVDVLEVVRRG